MILLLTLALACAGSSSAAATPGGGTLRVGSQLLRRCGARVWCGRLLVPLDRRHPGVSPRIAIVYRWYPATEPGGAPAGTVVPVEGGPGYPSIGSVAGGYATMYGPLLRSFNMLVVDNRGTGASTPLDCPPLQDYQGATNTVRFQRTAGRCAAALNHRWRYAGGRWVRASDLFTSAPAAEDLAAVIRALGLTKVDLYGDSYGSWFAQVFASRFPELLRSVILDSTYQTIGLDPWYRSTIQDMPADFDAACERWSPCAQAAPGSAWSRIEALAASLRRHPVSAVVPGPSGGRERVSMNVVGLVDLLNDAAGDTSIYREIDAAARALLDDGRPAPLLRLYAQRLAFDEAYFGGSAAGYSVELYLAVSCLDYPQLFDMRDSVATRERRLAAAEAQLPAGTFAPFSTGEWLSQDQNTEAYTACLRWPAPTSAQPPIARRPPLLPPSVPVLVLGGELDTWTPPSGVPPVLVQIGGHSRFIELANSTHVVGEGDTVCGSTLVREFVADPQAVDQMDASCAAQVPPIHAVGMYPSSLSEQPPLTAGPGNQASTQELRLAAAAVQTAGDAVARYEAIGASFDHGLYGGAVHADRAGNALILRSDELVPGVAVSGKVSLLPAAEAVDGQQVHAALSATASGVPALSLHAGWTTSGAGASATVLGTAPGGSLAGSMLAP